MAKFARPHTMTETAVPRARAVVGYISVGMRKTVLHVSMCWMGGKLSPWSRDQGLTFREPADAETARRDEEYHGARDADGGRRDVQLGGILGEGAEDGQEEEADGQAERAPDHECPAADGIDEDPGERHEEEVGDVVSLGDVLCFHDTEAQELNVRVSLEKQQWQAVGGTSPRISVGRTH